MLHGKTNFYCMLGCVRMAGLAEAILVASVYCAGDEIWPPPKLAYLVEYCAKEQWSDVTPMHTTQCGFCKAIAITNKEARCYRTMTKRQPDTNLSLKNLMGSLPWTTKKSLVFYFIRIFRKAHRLENTYRGLEITDSYGLVNCQICGN